MRAFVLILFAFCIIELMYSLLALANAQKRIKRYMTSRSKEMLFGSFCRRVSEEWQQSLLLLYWLDSWDKAHLQLLDRVQCHMKRVQHQLHILILLFVVVVVSSSMHWAFIFLCVQLYFPHWIKAITYNGRMTTRNNTEKKTNWICFDLSLLLCCFAYCLLFHLFSFFFFFCLCTSLLSFCLVSIVNSRLVKLTQAKITSTYKLALYEPNNIMLIWGMKRMYV